MNPPQVYMCSPSWTLLPPPSPFHPSGSSQCTSPKHPLSCIEPGLATCFIHDILHVSMPGDLPDQGIEPGSPKLQADSSPAELPGTPLTFFYNILIIWSLLPFFFSSFLSLPFFPSFPLQRWCKGVFSDVCKLSLKAGLHQHLCPYFELMLSSVHVTCPFIRIGISHTHSQTLSKV